ncbi:MAG TPA: ACP S-malonyltransferase [Isosphaeraceae bacterium]|nr:ACP S-malonyltransferase [Isosphaeraceae bacterium]
MFFKSAKIRGGRGEGRWRVFAPRALEAEGRIDPVAIGRTGPGPGAGARPSKAAPAVARPAPDGRKGGGTDLKGRIGTASFAFRGYDRTNLGRSAELLEHPVYGPVVRAVLDEASGISSEALTRPIDLAARIRARAASSLDTFAEDIATIVAMQMAQLRLLEEFFGVPVREAKQSFGYSIGELSTVILGGVFSLEQLLPVPLGFAADCAAMSEDATMAVLFSRSSVLQMKDVQALCMAVCSQGKGLVGPSAYLSPNTVLLIGQGDTLDRIERAIPEFLPERTNLRRKPHRWPPMHTPLVWRRNIPNRTAVALYQIEGGMRKPTPTVVSCVTGAASFDGLNSRDILIRWVDHPQLLWDVIHKTLVTGVELVIHVGPAPNLIPATFERLGNNVAKQLDNRYLQLLGRGVCSSMNRYTWLPRRLPKAALIRALFLEHVILEDWLLEQSV